MKDITRIHIAKVPYNVELSAKKELEAYIDALESYTADSELLQDIEIRMTELLLERGVKQEDVISEADVVAIREQLGEPKEFMTDDATLEVDEEVLSKDGNRKLYRNRDGAILGGVLAGVASYLRINALWVRLVFIALIFVSFGLFVLLYVVLWVIVPPARTAAEKLQMAGRPVTLTSIRELNEVVPGVNIERRAAIMKRIATSLLGFFSVLGAFVSIGIMVAFTVEIVANRNDQMYNALADYQLPVILGYIAGSLLTVLFLIVAVAAFAQKFNKRIWISGVVIIALGLSTFGTAVGLAAYQQRLEYEEVQRNTVETTLKLPDDFRSVTSLSVDAATGSNIEYIADDSTTSLKQKGLKDSPKATVTVENGVAKLKLSEPKTNLSPWVSGATITVYGPRLDSILVSNGQVSYQAGSQEKLKAEVYNGSLLRISGSRIDDLNLRTDGTAHFSAEEAAVAAVKASIYGQSTVNLGNIKTLNVTNPDVCAAYRTAELSIQNIVSASYTHNGLDKSVTSSEGPCLKVEFASDDVDTY